MFQYSREKILESCSWEPERSRPICFFEAFKTTGDDHFRHEYISDGDVGDWIAQKGTWSLPRHLQEPGPDKIKGGLRILLFERSSTQRFSVTISRSSYELLEKGFSIHPSTLESMMNFIGICAQFAHFDKKNKRNWDRISYVIKANQKQFVANYCLSITHDFSTSMTTGIICGSDLIQLGVTNIHDLEGQLFHLKSLLTNTSDMWLNPILLPTIILSDYLMRLKKHNSANHEFLITAEALLGVSKSGKLANRPLDSSLHNVEWNVEKTRKTIRQVTEDLATRKTEVIYFTKCCEWTISCARFLQEAVTHLRNSTHADPEESLDRLQDIIRYQTDGAKGNAEFVTKLKERAELQLDILYSFIAQNDNKLNARAAAAASRDSMAMKVLAVITAVFLPGSFVASLFSMDMFTWSRNPNSDRNSVSVQFWIYWVTSIPLTFLVLLVWRIWWKWEKDAFDRELGLVLDQVDKPSSVSPFLVKPKIVTESTWNSIFSRRDSAKTERKLKPLSEDA